jgi:hypothetical protein
MSDNRYYVKLLKKGYYFPRRPVATTWSLPKLDYGFGKLSNNMRWP